MAGWRSISLAWLGLGLAFANALPGSEHGPLEAIRASNDSVLKIFASGREIDRAARAEIFEIIESVTDLDRIAFAATERHHPDLSPEQAGRLLDVFKRLLKASSMSKVGRYRADRFEYLGEEITEDRAVVRTVAHSGEESMTIDYIMRRMDGRWMIINYIADDVDTIRNYRKQFLKLFKRHSVDEVIARLEQKIREFERESPKDPPHV